MPLCLGETVFRGDCLQTHFVEFDCQQMQIYVSKAVGCIGTEQSIVYVPALTRL